MPVYRDGPFSPDFPTDKRISLNLLRTVFLAQPPHVRRDTLARVARLLDEEARSTRSRRSALAQAWDAGVYQDTGEKDPWS